MWILIGLGPNDVQVPCLWFSTKEKGYAYVADALERTADGDTYWDIDHEFDNIRDAEGDYHNSELAKKFFTKYYDGCGGCWRLRLASVDEATPFVGFDLD